MNEYVADCCLTPNEQFFTAMYIMTRTSYFRRDARPNDVSFVLNQKYLLDFNSTSSQKQPSVGRRVAALRHIIPIPSQFNQPKRQHVLT